MQEEKGKTKQKNDSRGETKAMEGGKGKAEI